jgi:tetratricopeptide (TPR) repeat protein
MQQFFKYVLEQPKDFLKNLGYKSVQFFSSREIPRTFDIYLAARYSPLLSALTFKIGKFGFPFGLFLPLAIFGLISKAKKIPAPIVLFLALYPISVILVFAAARYRAPVIPVMSLFAAAGLMIFINLIRTARWVSLAAFVTFAVLIGGASSIAGPFTPEKFNFEAEMHYCIGYHMWENEDFDQAQVHLSKAVSLMPDYADAHNILGRTLYEKGQYQQARQHLETAIKLNPLSYSGHYHLGRVMLELGENSVALEEFEKAAELAAQAGNIRSAKTAKQAAANCRKQAPQDR